jgi:hypothetical protein
MSSLHFWISISRTRRSSSPCHLTTLTRYGKLIPSLSRFYANFPRSAPFSGKELDRTHIRLDRKGQRGTKTYLMKIEAHIEGASMFIHIARESGPWPLQLRNETDLDLDYRQKVFVSCLVRPSLTPRPNYRPSNPSLAICLLIVLLTSPGTGRQQLLRLSSCSMRVFPSTRASTCWTLVSNHLSG